MFNLVHNNWIRIFFANLVGNNLSKNNHFVRLSKSASDSQINKVATLFLLKNWDFSYTFFYFLWSPLYENDHSLNKKRTWICNPGMLPGAGWRLPPVSPGSLLRHVAKRDLVKTGFWFFPQRRWIEVAIGIWSILSLNSNKRTKSNSDSYLHLFGLLFPSFSSIYFFASLFFFKDLHFCLLYQLNIQK